MRIAIVSLGLLAAASPAFAADVSEEFYGSYAPPRVEREVVYERPVRTREVVEERVIVRRPPPVVYERVYVEDYGPRRFHRFHDGWERGRRHWASRRDRW